MDSGADEESALQKKKAAALQRIEDHIEWKRSFFRARPPPPPIGRLHRRQQGKTKNHSCNAAFRTALAMHSQRCREGDARSKTENIVKVEDMRITNTPLTSSAAATAAVSVPASRQEAWARQLHSEKERRNPSTDLNVRSDPTRTVIMANLHPETVEEDLRHFADQFGRVLNVRIVRHHKTGKSRRYAFVEFGLAGEARKAMQFHRKKRLKGHAIIIDREKGRTEANFLPKRMAAAELFLAAQAASHGGATAAVAQEGEGLNRDGTRLHDGKREGMAESRTVTTSAALSIPEDDDDFLNSILNS